MTPEDVGNVVDRIRTGLNLLREKADAESLGELSEIMQVLDKDLTTALANAFGGTFDWIGDLEDLEEFEDGATIYPPDIFFIKGSQIAHVPVGAIGWALSDLGSEQWRVSIARLVDGIMQFEIGDEVDYIVVQQRIECKVLSVLMGGLKIVDWHGSAACDDVTDEVIVMTAEFIHNWTEGKYIVQTEVGFTKGGLFRDRP